MGKIPINGGVNGKIPHKWRVFRHHVYRWSAQRKQFIMTSYQLISENVSEKRLSYFIAQHGKHMTTE